ncbi:PilZ domain-containing protein [Niveispirillum sp. BGYR6]|uniref:PilZ domain-containing protein n=1 Tax=Niveispirillum sp. BGYR6 TaxID=2971249 RepID=UPI0022B9A18A|nr:PilZ domain-containing protein [Niveispirillum sp. BGYR6]MDG5496642.1 PilZ domain-containing protein [Niveispirillum sp. BGYR6]
MRSQFFERRRQLREPVTDGQALIAGQPFGLLNWSQNGLLLAAAGPLPERGSRLSAEIDLMAGPQHFAFPAELRVVRTHPDRGQMAVSYVCLDVPVARRIQAYFQPTAQARFIADGVQATPPAAAEAEKPKPVVTATTAREEAVSALREISALKAAFARKFHPDTAKRDGSYGLRVELFKEFWTDLEAAESRLKAPPAAKS